MSIVTIDESKCKRDGICVAECPLKILAMADKESVPAPVPGADALCIDCGHCVAVCPHGALSQRTMDTTACPPVNPDWQLGPEQAEHFLRSRRSIRVYKKKTVEKEMLTRLIKVASFAPSGHNRQSVHWQVVYDTAELKTLTGLVVDWMRYMVKEQPDFAASMHLDLVIGAWEADVDTVCRDAPHLILVHAEKADPTAQTACTIGLTYLELATQSFGLGACWAGFFNVAAMFWPPMQKALALPDGHGACGAMMVGYPKFKYHRLPLRNTPRITWR